MELCIQLLIDEFEDQPFDICTLNDFFQTGETEIPGLTTDPVPRRLGPKRASHLRKLFNLGKQDDVRQYVIKRPLPVKEGKEVKKPTAKAPKIQRLVTPTMLQVGNCSEQSFETIEGQFNLQCKAN